MTKSNPKIARFRIIPVAYPMRPLEYSVLKWDRFQDAWILWAASCYSYRSRRDALAHIARVYDGMAYVIERRNGKKEK